MALDEPPGRPDEGRRRPAVMADVARLAGVSHQTVSRVLNDGVVAEATRTRVLEAIRLLDYRPNRTARALVTGRTNTIGVISFDTTLHGPASTLLGIEQAAHDRDYFTSIVSLRSLAPPDVLVALQRLKGQGVDGIAVITPQLDAVGALPSLPDDVAVVAVEAGPQHGFPVAAIDQVAGAADVTQHLLDLGHRTVVHIAGPRTWDEAERRVDGWRATLARAGAPVVEPLWGDWSARDGYELGKQVLERPDVTAVFAANDQMALGLLHACHEAGRTVPGELSIAGFDDIPEAPYFTPPLTTVRQPFSEMGRLALELLLAEIKRGRRSAERAIIAPELVIRASTAPPPG
jgi:DNA-binding LacI/PurR family transcriptional regulator